MYMFIPSTHYARALYKHVYKTKCLV